MENDICARVIGKYCSVFNEPENRRKKMNTVIVLSKDFAANESAVVDLKSWGFVNPLKALTFQNKTGRCAKFIWQGDMIYNKEKAGYFKEINNDLGVKVSHYEGFITITNGGGEQHLEGEVKL